MATDLETAQATWDRLKGLTAKRFIGKQYSAIINAAHKQSGNPGGLDELSDTGSKLHHLYKRIGKLVVTLARHGVSVELQ